MSTQKKWTSDDWLKWQRECIREELREEQESRRAKDTALRDRQKAYAPDRIA